MHPIDPYKGRFFPIVSTTTTTTILLPFGFCPGQLGWIGTRKIKPDLLEQEIVSGTDINWAISKSAPHPRHNHASIPPLIRKKKTSCNALRNSIGSHKYYHYHYWIWMARLDLLLLHFQWKKQESREPWLCDMCSLLHWTPYTLHLLRDAIDSALMLLVG